MFSSTLPSWFFLSGLFPTDTSLKSCYQHILGLSKSGGNLFIRNQLPFDL